MRLLIIQKIQLLRLRNKVSKAIEENLLTTEKSINEISQIFRDFKKYKYNKHDSFLNLCIFSDIINIDITLLLENIRLSKREQEKKLYSRVLATTIVDYLENINSLIGKDCLQELNNNNMIEFVVEFKRINKNFSNFRKENERILRDIRNNTLAHKSKDALILNEKIQNINIKEIYNFGIQMKFYSKEFVDLSTKIILYIVDYMKEGRKL